MEVSRLLDVYSELYSDLLKLLKEEDMWVFEMLVDEGDECD